MNIDNHPKFKRYNPKSETNDTVNNVNNASYDTGYA